MVLAAIFVASGAEAKYVHRGNILQNVVYTGMIILTACGRVVRQSCAPQTGGSGKRQGKPRFGFLRASGKERP